MNKELNLFGIVTNAIEQIVPRMPGSVVLFMSLANLYNATENLFIGGSMRTAYGQPDVSPIGMVLTGAISLAVGLVAADSIIYPSRYITASKPQNSMDKRISS